MYQGLYDYANKHAVKRDLFVAKANWHKGSRTFARPIKARSAPSRETYSPPPHHGAAKYPGLYRYARANFVKRDMVLEVFEAQPWQPLPEWVSRLTRGPRSFRRVEKVLQPA